MAQTDAQDTFQNAASSLPDEVPAGLPRSRGRFDGDPELPGKPGPGCEFFPVRTCQSCGCRLLLSFLARSSCSSVLSLAQFLPYRKPVRNSGISQNLASVSGTRFTHSLNSFLGPLACVRVRHPGMDKILPAPVLGLLPAWSGGPRRHPAHCDSCYWNASLDPWPVTYSGGYCLGALRLCQTRPVLTCALGAWLCPRPALPMAPIICCCRLPTPNVEVFTDG